MAIPSVKNVSILVAIFLALIQAQNVPESKSEFGQEKFDLLEGSKRGIEEGREPSVVIVSRDSLKGSKEGREPSVVIVSAESGDSERSYSVNGEELRRVKREESEEETSKYKKTSITKKPTSLIKSKPQLLPLKSTTAIPYSSSSIDHGQGHGLGSSDQLVSSSTATGTSDGTSFFAPEDVTLPPNSTTDEDHHMYYNSTILNESDDVINKYWLKLEDSSVHEMLSSSHRRAATINLKFPFPFYGHPIKNITIATGGFLYLGETVHSWLAATQYIAPLMANFDTSIHNFSSIRYVNNETHFIVQWNNVELQDSTPPGNFSFQVTLKLNGDIVFVYHLIPFNITEIPDSKHPVKVGISDAYVIDRTVFFIRRKTIYEYHRADLKKENISNNTAIYFTALPTCVSFTNCDSCLNAKIAFDCKWCDSVERCSDGFDRHRQDWLSRKCDSDSQSKDTPNKCKIAPPPVTNSSLSPNSGISPYSGTSSNVNPGAPWSSQGPGSSTFAKGSPRESDKSREAKDGASGSKAGALFFLILIAMITGAGFWVFYAYKNPTTGAGQFLIKYRPAEWRWNNGPETRLMEIR